MIGFAAGTLGGAVDETLCPRGARTTVARTHVGRAGVAVHMESGVAADTLGGAVDGTRCPSGGRTTVARALFRGTLQVRVQRFIHGDIVPVGTCTFSVTGCTGTL